MSNKLLTVVRTVFLARLLSPTDFGHMGIALLVIGLLQTFTQTGFASALVQRKGELDDGSLNAVWTIEVIRGVLVATMLFISAPLVSGFFDAPAASGLTRLLALGVMINSLTNIGIVTFDKELAFQKRFVFRSITNLVDLLISVMLALILRSPWALAFGWVAARLTTATTSYLVHSFRPRLRWKPDRVQSLLLLIWGLIRSLLATTGPLLRGVGKPQQATKVQLLQLVLLAVFIYPLTIRFGLVGAAWATVLAAIVPDTWALKLAGREATASLGSIGRVLAYPTFNALIMDHRGRRDFASPLPIWCWCTATV